MTEVAEREMAPAETVADDVVARDARRGKRAEKLRAHAKVLATQILLVVVIVAAWQWAASQGVIDEFFFGKPSAIGQSLVDWVKDGSLFTDILVTMYEAVAGFVIAVVLAVPIGVALGRSEFWGRVFHPLIDLANSTPRFALAPLFTLILGLGFGAKIVLVISVVFFIMLINTIAGVKSVDEDWVRMTRLMGANRRDVFIKVMLPSTVEWLVAGMRLAAPYALAAAVIGEMISATEGLGHLVIAESGALDTSGVLAAILVLSVLGWMLHHVAGGAARRAMRSRGQASDRAA